MDGAVGIVVMVGSSLPVGSAGSSDTSVTAGPDGGVPETVA